jgi:hypothetical protein
MCREPSLPVVADVGTNTALTLLVPVTGDPGAPACGVPARKRKHGLTLSVRGCRQPGDGRVYRAIGTKSSQVKVVPCSPVCSSNAGMKQLTWAATNGEDPIGALDPRSRYPTPRASSTSRQRQSPRG